MNDFERELEAELHRILDPMAAEAIPPRRPVQGGFRKWLLGGAGAAVGVKVLTGIAVAAAAVTVAGAATETVITGSLNPAVWGQQVREQVTDCKALLAAGQHGIGACVSDFTNGHGQAVASSARHHGKGNGEGPPNGNGAGNGNGNASGHKRDRDHSGGSNGAGNGPANKTGGAPPPSGM